MDIEYILEELKPLDYYKENKCLTLLFPENIVIFLREREDDELMWHVFENKQSIDAAIDFNKYQTEYGNIVGGKPDQEIEDFIKSLKL